MNAFTRTHRFAALLLLALLASGCSRVLRQPEVRLAGVRVGGIGLRGGTLYAQLEVENPNSFGLRAEGLRYDLDLRGTEQNGDSDWLDLTEGSLPERIEVGGGETRTFEVPIQFTYDRLGGALRSLLDTGTFNYRVRGTVAVQSPVRRDVPFKREGTVSLAGVR